MKEKAHEIEMEVLPPESQAQKDEFARVLAYILDDLIPIPGTKYRRGRSVGAGNRSAHRPDPRSRRYFDCGVLIIDPCS